MTRPIPSLLRGEAWAASSYGPGHMVIGLDDPVPPM